VKSAGVSLEPAAILIAGALGCIGWTLYAGPDLNWDLLHYHLYVGLHASGDTLATDYFPAGSTSYLAPYAYWPLATMVAAKWPAMLVGLVMVTMHSLAVLTTWYLAKQLFPGASREDILLRLAATCVAAVCALVLTEIGTSFADITAAIPAVLGVALWLKALAASRLRGRAFALSGLCFGLAVALKLTSVPFAVAAYASLMLLWCVRPDVGWRDLAVFGGTMAAGFAAGYGYWGFQLWREFGNPFFPLFHAFFQPPEVLAVAPGAGVSVAAPRSSLLVAVSDILSVRRTAISGSCRETSGIGCCARSTWSTPLPTSIRKFAHRTRGSWRSSSLLRSPCGNCGNSSDPAVWQHCCCCFSPAGSCGWPRRAMDGT